MSDPTETLLLLVDQAAEDAAHHIRDRVFSAYRDLPWTDDQRRQLQPIIRREVDTFIYRLRSTFDNAGGVLPDGVLGYQISAMLDDGLETVTEIGTGYDDYGAIWLDYLLRKPESDAGIGREGRP